MTGIINYDFYNTEMGRAMMDKLFFLHHVDAKYFVDYGCADGQMIEAMRKLVNAEFCGYDNDLHMIDFAKQRHIPRAAFRTEWQEVKFDKAYVSEYGGQEKSCLILSSIIHEIYSYGNEESINEFWNRVFNSGFDYIVIRDMALDANTQYSMISPKISEQLRAKADSGQWKDFEDQFGEINCVENAVHFLLKYRYIDNWDREVKENYFPLTVEDITKIRLSLGNKYEQTYFTHFNVPFIRKQIRTDFGIDIAWNTHYKAIWELKK